VSCSMDIQSEVELGFGKTILFLFNRGTLLQQFPLICRCRLVSLSSPFFREY
jgi:hypothetical protein